MSYLSLFFDLLNINQSYFLICKDLFYLVDCVYWPVLMNSPLFVDHLFVLNRETNMISNLVSVSILQYWSCMFQVAMEFKKEEKVSILQFFFVRNIFIYTRRNLSVKKTDLHRWRIFYQSTSNLDVRRCLSSPWTKPRFTFSLDISRSVTLSVITPKITNRIFSKTQNVLLLV